MDIDRETQGELLGAGLLSMRPGDALIIKPETQLDPAEADKLTKHVKALLGVSQVLVLAPDAKIAVLRVGASE
jgi:hypothetical protein